ncbi:MAG: hypothetical protein L3J83_05220 [Proteobacteria bacterium]|nr:hypothetical protein [Pseudomonadota bacterium]
MKKIIILVTSLFMSTTYNIVHAQLVGSGFSYQGELVDNNVPANGEYDMFFEAFGDEVGGIT